MDVDRATGSHHHGVRIDLLAIAPGQQRLERDIVALLGEFNTAGAASLVVPGEYLEVVITVK